MKTFALLLTGLCCVSSFAQRSTGRHICVRDSGGAPVGGVILRAEPQSQQSWVTEDNGCATLPDLSNDTQIQAVLNGFDTATVPLGVGRELEIHFQRSVVKQEVVVTALRMPLPLDATASAVRSLSATDLQQAPGFSLDDQLRQVAGFQLFRRTSSWTANPTSQGISLRGLGSTAASRTLVLSDQVPLNDPFLGSIHWNEIPQLAVRQVEVMRGGASDLYGSSAIGGVIQVVPVRTDAFRYAADLSGASQATSLLNGLLTGKGKGVQGMAAATFFRTDGYITQAPISRGSIDTASNVHSQSGRTELRGGRDADHSYFLRGNLLNEARNNGTFLQTNATRIWRYNGGGDWATQHAGRGFLRLYGSNEGYRQSFTATGAGRNSERLTRLQWVPSQELGAAAQWAGAPTAHLVLAAGFDSHDIRANNIESAIGTTGLVTSTTSINGRQRQTGAYGEAIWQQGGWSASLSGRVDRFSTFDASTLVSTSPNTRTPQPRVGETVFNPRFGLVRSLGSHLSVNGSVFRAFRGPTLNELYRTGQVGSQTTLANPNLRSERATGFEFGGLVQLPRSTSLRASYFWTEVNRPITAVTISQTPTTQTLARQNLGQLKSRGLMLEADLRPIRAMLFSAGYQLAVATVTRFSADPTLVGKWTPQVPRNAATLRLQMQKERIGTLNFISYIAGRQYDDSANTFMLRGYSRFDAYAERKLIRGLSVYASGQNLFDRTIEVGRTPTLTLGARRIVTFGLRLAGGAPR